MRVLAVDDERPALDDLARVLRAQPAVDERRHGRVRRGGAARADAASTTTRSSSTCACRASTASSSRGVLRRFAAPPALIFVSAYESAAVEAFELRALDYLLKPVARARVAEALRARSARSRPRTRTDTLAVDVPGGGTRLVRRDDVLYLQAHGDYVRVVTADGRFLVRGTLGEIERRWAPHGFHRVHRRFLVNLRRAARGAPAAQRHRGADPGRRRRAADRPPRGRRAAAAAALMSRLPTVRPRPRRPPTPPSTCGGCGASSCGSRCSRSSPSAARSARCR